MSIKVNHQYIEAGSQENGTNYTTYLNVQLAGTQIVAKVKTNLAAMLERDTCLRGVAGDVPPIIMTDGSSEHRLSEFVLAQNDTGWGS